MGDGEWGLGECLILYTVSELLHVQSRSLSSSAVDKHERRNQLPIAGHTPHKVFYIEFMCSALDRFQMWFASSKLREAHATEAECSVQPARIRSEIRRLVFRH